VVVGLVLQARGDPDDEDGEVEQADVGERAVFEEGELSRRVEQEGEAVDDYLDQAVELDGPEDDYDEEQPKAKGEWSAT
jgi:hypothetical protein